MLCCIVTLLEQEATLCFCCLVHLVSMFNHFFPSIFIYKFRMLLLGLSLVCYYVLTSLTLLFSSIVCQYTGHLIPIWHTHAWHPCRKMPFLFGRHRPVVHPITSRSLWSSSVAGITVQICQMLIFTVGTACLENSFTPLLSVQLSQPYIATGHTSAFISRIDMLWIFPSPFTSKRTSRRLWDERTEKDSAGFMDSKEKKWVGS